VRFRGHRHIQSQDLIWLAVSLYSATSAAIQERTMSLDNTPASGPQTRRAIHALHAATWFALTQGDRYSALGRKSVANAFYNILPMLAEVRKAMLDEGEPASDAVSVAAAAAAAATAVALPDSGGAHAINDDVAREDASVVAIQDGRESLR
jgi:hypothetical protein